MEKVRRRNASAFSFVLLMGSLSAIVCGCGTRTDFSPPPRLERDDFNEFNTSLWRTVKGRPRIEDGWLVLSSTPGRGVEVQSRDFFQFNALEFRAASEQWAADTSLGYEYWDGSVYRGIVVKDGRLRVVDQSEEAPNEWFQPIPNWAAIADQPNVFKIRWTELSVQLFLNGSVSPALTYSGPLIPDQPLKVRFNASNDVQDVLKVDYVVVGEEAP